ncbi:hypothetical protein ACHAXS_014101 [Conticribra weissflogii]
MCPQPRSSRSMHRSTLRKIAAMNLNRLTDRHVRRHWPFPDSRPRLGLPLPYPNSASSSTVIMKLSNSDASEANTPSPPPTSVKAGTAPETRSFQKASNAHKPSPLAGMPVGPTLVCTSRDDGGELTSSKRLEPVLVRYIYEGANIAQGRLCVLDVEDDQAGVPDGPYAEGSTVVTIPQIIQALRNDGVDFDLFYACAYEAELSSGGWMPLEPAPRYENPFRDMDHANGNHLGKEMSLSGEKFELMNFYIPSSAEDGVPRRIDIKLFRRPRPPARTSSQAVSDEAFDLDEFTLQQQQHNHSERNQAENDNEPSTPLNPKEHTSSALHALSSSIPTGHLPLHDGYFGIGIFHPKTSPNIGTLWRSAYQLGASILYTIGGRYKVSATDTLNVPARMPLVELDDWNSFAEWAAPKGAVWVVVEMGGTPLEEFVHPRNAIYVLGSEDHGEMFDMDYFLRELFVLFGC